MTSSAPCYCILLVVTYGVVLVFILYLRHFSIFCMRKDIFSFFQMTFNFFFSIYLREIQFLISLTSEFCSPLTNEIALNLLNPELSGVTFRRLRTFEHKELILLSY